MVAIVDKLGIRYEANTVADLMELVRQYRDLPVRSVPETIPTRFSLPLSNSHPRVPLKSPLPEPPRGPACHGYGIDTNAESYTHHSE